MQKVITITSYTGIVEQNKDFKESEYPQLNKYLKEGYTIKQAIPIVKPADQSYMYAITFILEN